jgi:hypothetical protein
METKATVGNNVQNTELCALRLKDRSVLTQDEE